MRAAAFTLFGSLSRFGNGPSEKPFLEQIQTNFVSMLLHLNEGDPVVVAVSWTLGQGMITYSCYLKLVQGMQRCSAKVWTSYKIPESEWNVPEASESSGLSPLSGLPQWPMQSSGALPIDQTHCLSICPTIHTLRGVVPSTFAVFMKLNSFLFCFLYMYHTTYLSNLNRLYAPFSSWRILSMHFKYRNHCKSSKQG